ncbi:zinc-dependent alcohol dehydrogenase [Micromonospora schwarzwaldensis]|uniref:zinc-dependent alcohol dehydrogenase n=1 Tax=Micromonospora sp. DSM 45708 TaxID=3111767 RepID=UPI0031E43FAB
MSDRFEGIGYALTSAGELVGSPTVTVAARTVVRVDAAGICGTDLAEYRRRCAEPGVLPDVALGHEVAGTVVHSDEGWAPGTRVVIDPAIHCGSCARCVTGRTSYCERLLLLGHNYGAGGLARYVSVPGSALLEVPPGLDPVTAALVEPLACAHHAAAKVPGEGPVLVLGAGTIGLGVALFLRARGVEVSVTDPVAARAALTRSLGLPTDRPDTPCPVVVEASGTAAGFAEALGAVDRGGTVVVAAQHPGVLAVDAGTAFGKEVTIGWSLGALRPDFRATLALLADGVIDPRPLASPMAPADLGTGTLRDMAAGRTAKPVVVWPAQA